ncbi:MAG: metallophosphoesterase family protein [Candidatus Omnitrophota bacterium]
MKIGVLSDTHIPDRARELPCKLLESFKDAAMIIHAGDFVDLSVHKALCAVCKDVKAVCGNMDPSEIKEMFPQRQIIKAGAFTIGVVHGWGPPTKLLPIVKEAFKSEKPDIVIFGHSHQACSVQDGKTLYFNPGSPTDNVFAPFKSFGIIDINDTINARIVKL